MTDGRSSVATLALLDRVRALVRAGADDHILAFSWPPRRLMTYVLKAMLRERRVLGLNVSHGGGTAWMCTGSDESSCGPHTMNGCMTVPLHAIQLGTG